MSAGAQDPCHPDLELLAAGWALNALEPLEESTFAVHLRRCLSCQQIIVDMSATLGQLSQVCGDAEPPPELRAQIMLAAADGDQLHAIRICEAPLPRRVRQSAPTAIPVRPRKSSCRPFVLVAAAIALIMACGTTFVVHSQQSENSAAEQALIRELEQPRSRIATLTTTTGLPVGYLVVSNGRVELIADGIGPNESDTSYWVWMTGADGTHAATPLSAFSISQQSSLAITPLTVSPPTAGKARTFAISLEPGRATPTRPTAVVAAGTVQT